MVSGGKTAAIHEAGHQVRSQLGANIVADVPWAQALDRFYGLSKGFYNIDRRIGKPTLKDFGRRQRFYKDPQVALEKEPNWTYKVGNKIGQWAFEKLGREKGANYLFLRFWGKGHNEAHDIVNNNKMQATINEMRMQFRKRRGAEIVPLGREIKKAA